jgi:tRNA1(Val) A37 N6-methylase TrmN6
MEKTDFVNDALSLIQESGGLKFGTDALLLAGYVTGKYKMGIELGSGTGIITMLLLTREKLSSALCLEVQEEYARLTEKNAELNGLTDRMRAVCADIREHKTDVMYDLVYTNPPYMKTTSGRASALDKKNVARHEVFGDISDFLGAASRIVKFGGAFYAVYRPDRLADIVCAMRTAGIEPKEMQLVVPAAGRAANIVLIHGIKGAGPELRILPDIAVHTAGGGYTEEILRIYEREN